MPLPILVLCLPMPYTQLPTCLAYLPHIPILSPCLYTHSALVPTATCLMPAPAPCHSNIHMPAVPSPVPLPFLPSPGTRWGRTWAGTLPLTFPSYPTPTHSSYLSPYTIPAGRHGNLAVVSAFSPPLATLLCHTLGRSEENISFYFTLPMPGCHTHTPVLCSFAHIAMLTHTHPRTPPRRLYLPTLQLYFPSLLCVLPSPLPCLAFTFTLLFTYTQPSHTYLCALQHCFSLCTACCFCRRTRRRMEREKTSFPHTPAPLFLDMPHSHYVLPDACPVPHTPFPGMPHAAVSFIYDRLPTLPLWCVYGHVCGCV